jgi:hypothetical protein
MANRSRRRFFPALTDAGTPLNASWFGGTYGRRLLDIHIRVHDARRTYASMLLRRGLASPTLRTSLDIGHPGHRGLYGHFIPREDRQRSSKMAEAIEEARTQEAATLSQPDGEARS